ncbi:MAG: UDP-N-acetylmuramoyl-tripeptide--D-alanyl-D-alanine ligase [Clostridia bacterium]|nr:UDP-N-acetylmuramoyl-tripeptide--D-alanyl-D-alanine ligase [Clostridia bacterium]
MKIRLGLGSTDMEHIAQWCCGELYDFTGESGCAFEYICTDSREADENTMFVATRGERVDGHDYIIKAIEQGCRCILCEYVPTNISGKQAAYVVVENSIDAFADCAKGYRSNRYLPVVAITGSVGKTTTKELCAAILRRRFKTYCTEGNFNSVIGMPMSLMAADAECEVAVFEMGMSALGEIRRMTHAANPTVAMVTNIGSSHLEYLGTRENIARAKLEIGEGIVEGGYLLLNGDEPLLEDHYSDRYETVYIDRKNKINNVRVEKDGTHFDLHTVNGYMFDLRVPLIGEHFAYNAAFAAFAAYLFGVSESDIREGLASYVPKGMRMNISERDGVTVLADCYNAAPESMRAAIDTLSSFKTEGRRIAVLGDMKELGKTSDELHRQVGRYLANAGIDMLFTLGKSGALIAEEAIRAGVKVVFAEADGEAYASIAAEISDKLKAGDVILFKASRAMALENLIEMLFKD